MKTYALHQFKKLITWVSSARLHDYLLQHGIRPSSELNVGSRTYRQYDEEALTKVKALKRDYEERLLAKTNPAPAVKPEAPVADDERIERLTALVAETASRVATLMPIAKRVEEIHAMLDSLHDKIDSLNSLWDDAPTADGGAQ